MPVHDDLGVRMKTFYEQIPKTKLMRRCPVAIRIDGKAFHTFTRGFQKPFDEVLIKSMQETTKYLCENIQGCVLGYTQSDEITLILVDYKKLTSSAWFDYEVQKICSITASMATMAFNKLFEKYVDEYRFSKWDGVSNYEDNAWEYIQVLLSAVEKGAMFDARCFNIPKEEVTNLLYWRQDDAAKNSIQMVGRAFFSHKELHKKSRNDIQDMLMTQKGINWNDFPTYQKRGSCCIKTEEKIMEDITIIKNRFGEDGKKHVVNMKRPHWIIDTEIPIFKGEGREYIDRLVFVGEE
ncbi:tRNA(His) guanylyltransferase Thg1 family protein [Roseburia inulinivorans]|jgi:tRNA(His) 5'-end guanylyltransferase|uniref:tRNA(His) guanylyltransferase Thg1 family protein n=1 Tax=Roseburia inulinivorans TaxID=360807 RepID=UPI0032BFFE0D